MKYKVVFLSLLISCTSTNAMDNKQETKKPTLSVWAQVVAFVSSYFGKKEDSLSDQDFVKLLESTNQLTQTKLSEKETSS